MDQRDGDWSLCTIRGKDLVVSENKDNEGKILPNQILPPPITWVTEQHFPYSYLDNRVYAALGNGNVTIYTRSSGTNRITEC